MGPVVETSKLQHGSHGGGIELRLCIMECFGL